MSKHVCNLCLCKSGQLTPGALESAVLGKFRPLNHVPVWKDERPPKVHRIYLVGLTQRQALHGFIFRDDWELEQYQRPSLCKASSKFCVTKQTSPCASFS
jgi:hypothetical protein